MNGVLRRRTLMGGSVASGLLTQSALSRAARADTGRQIASRPVLVAQALPIQDVRLLPSPWLDALDTNTRYLMALEPDHLLHNFREQAGLKPKGKCYGGWEGQSIAGHTLGHYLSALSLCHAQTDNAEARQRVLYITEELNLCQSQDPSGYVAGFTCVQKGRTLSGKVAFEQIRHGQIHSTGFDLNGAWSPLYNWHKLFAGLLDAQEYCGAPLAERIMLRLGAYLEGVFAPLSEDQVQAVLSCEYGGLNESFAELYDRTGDARWLRFARVLQDHKVFDPLEQGRDELANLHSNTQIPKLIGAARLYELTGDPKAAIASKTFWDAVTGHYTYVIGGNGDREYFAPPDTISRHITEQTCETCSSYNMLKLTRQLYARDVNARYFDYYERTQLNHIRAAQHPKTGMFCYMTPLMAGAARQYSTPYDDFWCCVGSGMESHAKHGDSIYWQRNTDELLVNLFIASRVRWKAGGITLRMETVYPENGVIRLVVEMVQVDAPRIIALRLPEWSQNATFFLNEERLDPECHEGYCATRRLWQHGDVLEMRLDLPLHVEATSDNAHMLSLLHGPTVLAADLGPSTRPYTGETPTLVSADLLHALEAGPEPGTWRTRGAGRPDDVLLTAFYAQHDRLSAPYFPVFTVQEWEKEQARFRATEQTRKALAAHALDVFHPGEMQAERDHMLTSAISYPLVYRGRNGRDARSGGWFAFSLRTRAPSVQSGPMVLQVTYWGSEIKRRFAIQINGRPIARETLDGAHPDMFFSARYAVPEAFTAGGQDVIVKFVPEIDHSAGPVFGVALLRAEGLPPLSDPGQSEAWP